MTIFLRTKNNDTIIDCEILKHIDEIGKGYVEIHSGVCVIPYTGTVLTIMEEDHPKIRYDKIAEFALDIDTLSELRGWLWETYFMAKKNTVDEYDNVLNEVRKMFKAIADKYDLCVVED